MDNLTHSLTGIALARAGLDRFTPRATVLLLLSANIPDIDIVTLWAGRAAYFESHRGYTHTFLALPVLALACVLLTSALFRQKLPWFKAWLVCCVGILSHLLLDWTNSYGVRPLIPFSSRWFYLDLNGLYDWTIWIVLVGCLLWPVFSRLVGGEIGERRRRTGRGNAIFALSFFLLFDIGRAVLHGRAVAQLEARLYDGAAAVSVAALPRTFDPFHWRGIVETERTYRLLTVNTLGSFDPEDGPVFFKPTVTPAMLKVLETPAFHYMRYFARFPAWSEEPAFLDTGKGTRFDLTDLRFGFHCVGVLDSKGEVLQSEFSFGTPH